MVLESDNFLTKAPFDPLGFNLTKAETNGSKGAFVRKLSLSSTMGIGVRIDFSSLEK
jgi:hypothetical protein